jgi:hypothetical protein
MIRSFAGNRESIQVQGGMMDMGLEDTSIDGASVDTKPQTIGFNTSKDTKMSLICFGYGSDHNSDMLSAIAKETQGGAYYFIEHGTESNVASAFGDALGGVLSVVAQSAVLRISLPPFATDKGIKIVKVCHDNAILREDGVHTANINDFYAEETRDVVFEVKLAETPSEEPLPHALVTLSYFDAINGKSCIVGPLACRIARPDTNHCSPVNHHVEEQFARIQAVEDMKAAKREAEAGNYAAARSCLEVSANRMKSNTNVKAAYVADMVRDVEALTRGLESSASYERAGRHTMTCMTMSHGYQRAMCSAVPEGPISPSAMSRYTTAKKKTRSSQFQRSPKGTI